MATITQDLVENFESRLFAYRKLRFKATARVDIARLEFEKSFKNRMDNHRHVRRLERIMEIQGCQRLMKTCHVPVLVPASDWDHCVRLRQFDGGIDWLDVDVDYKLRAQDHENLISAARKRLGSNQWWLVDVYVVEQADRGQSDHKNFVRSLREHFPNDRRPSDGLIYERIRRYEGFLGDSVDRLAANNWWAILETKPGSKKGSYLRAFFKHPTLPQKLDSLLIIEGIWEGMKIGLLHKVVAMRCDEAIMCYWTLIFQTFLTLVGGNAELLGLIDGFTVSLIQSRAPKVSQGDLNFLTQKWENGDLFPYIPTEQRQEVWERLKDIDYPVPTLETFFRDRIYLEVGRSVMRQLFLPDPSRRVTIDEGVCEQFDTHVPVLIPHRHEMLKAELWELWRFSFQYGFEMTEHQRRVSRGNHSIPPRISSETHDLEQSLLWQHFFWLAAQKGFRTPLGQGSRPPPSDLPTPTSYEDGKEIPVRHRSGKPFDNSVEEDRFALSAESLQRPWSTPKVTAGFFHRSVFFAFFRYLIATGDGQTLGRRESGGLPAAELMEGVDVEPVQTPSATIPEPTMPPEPYQPSHLPAQQFRQEREATFPHVQQPTIFMMDVFLDGNTQTLGLPNDSTVLNEFFRSLEENYFHISNPGDNGKGLSASDCYYHYIQNPLSRLHASFRTKQSFVQHINYTLGESEGTELGLETAELEQAREWLNRAKIILAELNPASPGL